MKANPNEHLLSFGSPFLKALVFATEAHKGQVRDYSGEDYIVHPIAVAALVANTAGVTTEMAMAAVLHDTVEDTAATHDEILRRFGKDVAQLVYYLTNRATHADGNRTTRRNMDREQMKEASPEAMTIRLADMADNLKDIAELSPGFAKVYLPEKLRMLEVLKEGDSVLWHKCLSLISQSGLITDPDEVVKLSILSQMPTY